MEAQNPKLKVVNSGVRAFGRSDVPVDINSAMEAFPFRLHTEIVPLIYPFIRNCSRVVAITHDDFLASIAEEFPQFGTFSEEVRRRLATLSMGGIVFVYSDETTMRVPIVLSVWKAKTSVNLLLNKKDRMMLKTRLVLHS